MTPAPKPRGGARPGAGRKPGSARSGLRRTLLLSHEAIAVLDAVPERQRGAVVSTLIETAWMSVARAPQNDRVLRAIYTWCAMAAALEGVSWRAGVPDTRSPPWFGWWATSR